jgi:hypothetical protein
LRKGDRNDGTALLNVLLDQYLGGVFFKEPILIPLSIFTEYLILDGGLVGLLIEAVDFGLTLFYLIIELLDFTGKAVLLIGQVGDLLLDPLAFLAADCLQFLFKLINLGLKRVFFEDRYDLSISIHTCSSRVAKRCLWVLRLILSDKLLFLRFYGLDLSIDVHLLFIKSGLFFHSLV